MKNYKDFKKQLLKDKQIKNAYQELGPEYKLIELIITKRNQQGLTQAQMAKKIGTQQSAIARLERGTYNPTLAFLRKVASAFNAELQVSFLQQHR
ncbi:MAG: helix-turn-helix transcriptional regulator [Candidatus Kerfeldbacteria bacterium]|nr:helix-turn-helix transcriptional regulator [Candidatus Kerfeldbacteria bacterium]